MRAGDLTWGALRGPRFRTLGRDTYVAVDVIDTPLLGVRAALVRAGGLSVATGWSACVVHGLDVARGTRPIEVAAGDRRVRPSEDIVVHQQRFAPDEVTTVDEVRVTTAIRTAYDLAIRSGPEWSAVDRVIDPLTDAVVAADALAKDGGFTADDLRTFAASHPRARDVTRVTRVAALLDALSDSPPETRTRVKLVLAGLPRPVLQHEVRTVSGRFVARVDLAWPAYRVAVEYDGRDHAVSDRRGRDLDRLDALRRLGWEVIVITAPQLARPRWVPDRVRDALSDRGWRDDGHREWADVVAENHRMY